MKNDTIVVKPISQSKMNTGNYHEEKQMENDCKYYPPKPIVTLICLQILKSVQILPLFADWKRGDFAEDRCSGHGDFVALGCDGENLLFGCIDELLQDAGLPVASE